MNTFDKKLEEVVKKHKIPAMSVMIIAKEKVILHTANGVRRIDKSDLISTNDSFHLGSCAKAFTATLMLKMMDEGKLDIEDSITTYLPELEANKFSDIKIKHLLSHSSGIVYGLDESVREKMYSDDLTPAQGRILMVKYLNQVERIAPAGEVYEYSNVGYTLLGHIIENVEQKPFEDAITEKLFKPFGMTSCSFGPAGKKGDSATAWGHDFEDGQYIPKDPKVVFSDNPVAYSPAGVISCTQEDWAKFILFIMGYGENRNYLRPHIRKLIFTENLDDYTYGGWGKSSCKWAGAFLAHSGSNGYNFAYAMVGLDMSYAMLINLNCGEDSAANDIAQFVVDFYLDYSKKI